MTASRQHEPRPTRASAASRATEDHKFLQGKPYADTAFLESDAWRALRIQGEFVEGFDAMARLGPAVTVFGSARLREDGAPARLRLRFEGCLTGGGRARRVAGEGLRQRRTRDLTGAMRGKMLSRNRRSTWYSCA